MNWLVTFADFYKQGGPFMHLILITAVAVLAVTLERFWVIGRAASLNAGKLSRDLAQRVSKGDISGAADLCRKVKGPVATVALAILSRNDSDEERLQNAADGAAMVVLPRLSRRLPHLSMLANTATLLGLLGTVFGLITAFSAVSAADPAQRSSFLAVGISQALNTTAFGLLIAVPTLLIHGFLVSKVESVVEHVDETAVRLIPSLCGKRAGGKTGDGPKSRMSGLLETQEA